MILKNGKIHPRVFLAALALSCSVPASTAQAQESSVAAGNVQVTSTKNAEHVEMKSLLAGSHFPLTIKFGSLTPEFRHFVLPPQNDSFATYMQMRGTSAGVELGVYFTRGETVQFNGDTYLAAYRPEALLNLKLLTVEGARVPGILAKPSPNNDLILSLLNLRTTGSFTDIRPYDPRLDALSPAESIEASQRQLSLLGEAFRAYLHDHNDIVPTMVAAVQPAVRQAIAAYSREPEIFIDPVSGQAYEANPHISGQNTRRVSNGLYLPAFAEGAAAADGLRTVLFLDGHVERVNDERWGRLQAVKPIARPLPSPVEVMAKVKAGLELQKSKLNAISLDCGPGVLRLQGRVGTLEQYRLAGKIARQQAPDYKVINQLKIQPTEPEPTAY